MAKNVIINKVTYRDVPYVQIPNVDGGNATFYDTSDATAKQENILTGTQAYVDGGKKNGSMPNNGNVGGTIKTKTENVVIPSGYTSGGTVSISTEEQEKLVSENIKSGVTILGQVGKSTVLDTTIDSQGATEANIMTGYKAYVNGALVTGVVTVPKVSQDVTTKVLSIM